MILTKNVSAFQFFETLVSRNPIKESSPIYCEFPHSPAEKTTGMWAGKPIGFNEESKRNNRYITVSAFYEGKRTKNNFACLLAVMLDDIGPKVNQDSIKLEPTFKLESSPNNYQYWYVLDEPITDFFEADSLIQAVVNRLKGLTPDNADPGSAGVTRYGRIPDSINNKYEQPWKVKCSGNPQRRFTKQELIDELNLTFDKVAPVSQFNPDSVGVMDRFVALHDPIVELIKAGGGLLKDRGHVLDIICPWVDEHSDAPETGASLLINPGGRIGFQCHHGHCVERTLKEFHQKITEDGYYGLTIENELVVHVEEKQSPQPKVTKETPSRGVVASLNERLLQLYREGKSEGEIQELVPALAQEYDYDFTTTRKIAESVRSELADLDRLDDAKEELGALVAADEATIDLANYLPADIYEALSYIQKSMNYAPEVVLTAFLTAFSGIQQTGMEIDIFQSGGNFKQPLLLYAAMIAASGQKKTPLFNNVISLPMQPLIDAEYREYELKLLASEELEGQNDEKIRKPSLLINAATVEGLLKRIESQPNKGILFFRDELAATFKSLNKYRAQGDDEEVLLELYDGGSFETARVDQKREISIRRSHLSIYGGIQDAVFSQLLKNGDGNGKFARFWFVSQPERASYLENFELDSSKGDQITATLSKYYFWARKTPAVSYTMSNEAYSVFKDAYNRYEDIKLNEDGPLKMIWGKSAGRVARLAAILHQLKQVNSPSLSSVIDPATISLADQLERILVNKARLLYKGASNEAPTKLKWALERLKRKKEITARGVSQASRRLSDESRKVSTAEARSLLKALADKGYGILKGDTLQALQ